MIQRFELYWTFSENDSKNWTLSFIVKDSKNWTFFFKKKKTHSKNSTLLLNLFIWLKRIFLWLKELIFLKKRKTSLQELNLFTWHKELYFLFFSMTQRIETLFFFSKKYDLQELNVFIQYDSRIEPFFLIRLTELNFFFFFFGIWLKEFFQKYDSQNCFFFKKKNIDSKNWTFFEYHSKDWNFFKCDSKNWTSFFVWHKDLNAFFFSMWLKELNPFLGMSQWIEPSFLHDSKAWAFLTWLKQLVLFCLDLPFLFCVGVEPLKLWPARPDIVPLYTLKNTIGPFLVWLKELILFFVWLKELNFFWTWLKELNLFFFFFQKYDSKNRTFFLNTTQRIELCFKKRFKEFNLFIFDSKN